VKAFTEHPASVGENYFQHMGTSFSFGAKMFVSSFACFAHGIAQLHERMVTHRHRDYEKAKTQAILETAE